jgi:glycosyltransferase involved in cell wall biosynthesis
MRLASRLCAAAIVSDLELAAHVEPYFRTVYVVPTPLTLPLPLADEVPADPPGAGPIVFHAPSDQLVKGTPTIRAAMDAVAQETPLRPLLISGVPRAEVLAQIARADVVVDQLNQVTTGVFALEAMALGKPVLLQYDRTLQAPFAQDVPAIAVTADTLAGELQALVADDARRAQLGRAGAEYVRRVHDAAVVVELLSQVYDDARAPRPGLFEATRGGIVPIPSTQR